MQRLAMPLAVFLHPGPWPKDGHRAKVTPDRPCRRSPQYSGFRQREWQQKQTQDKTGLQPELVCFPRKEQGRAMRTICAWGEAQACCCPHTSPEDHRSQVLLSPWLRQSVCCGWPGTTQSPAWSLADPGSGMQALPGCPQRTLHASRGCCDPFGVRLSLDSQFLALGGP